MRLRLTIAAALSLAMLVPPKRRTSPPAARPPRPPTGARRRSGVPRAVQGTGGDQHHAVGGLVHRSVQRDEGAPERRGLRGRATARHRAARPAEGRQPHRGAAGFRSEAQAASCCSRTSTWSKPIAPTGSAIRSSSSRRMDSSTRAAPSDDKAMAAVFADSHGPLQEGRLPAETHHQARADLR